MTKEDLALEIVTSLAIETIPQNLQTGQPESHCIVILGDGNVRLDSAPGVVRLIGMLGKLEE